MGRLGKGLAEGVEKSLWDVWGVLERGRSSPMRCSGFWEPGLVVPNLSLFSLGRALREGSGWTTQSPAEVGTRPLACEGACRGGALGDQFGEGVCWKLPHNTEAGSLPEQTTCALRKALRAREVASSVSIQTLIFRKRHGILGLAMCTCWRRITPTLDTLIYTCTPIHVQEL